MLTLVAVRTAPPATIEADLSDGKTLTLDLADIIESAGYESLSDPERFATVTLSDWGHGIEWPAIDQGLSIETLIRLAREQGGTAFPTVAFNAWMQRNGLSPATAARALGLSRRTLLHYHTGIKAIPIYIGLACEGWETRHGRQAA